MQFVVLLIEDPRTSRSRSCISSSDGCMDVFWSPKPWQTLDSARCGKRTLLLCLAPSPASRCASHRRQRSWWVFLLLRCWGPFNVLFLSWVGLFVFLPLCVCCCSGFSFLGFRQLWAGGCEQSLIAGEACQHILRVLNTNVDGRQKIMFALPSIQGGGRRFANLVCKKADVDMSKRIHLQTLLPRLARMI